MKCPRCGGMTKHLVHKTKKKTKKAEVLWDLVCVRCGYIKFKVW